jgi:hypothetical protein
MQSRKRGLRTRLLICAVLCLFVCGCIVAAFAVSIRRDGASIIWLPVRRWGFSGNEPVIMSAAAQGPIPAIVKTIAHVRKIGSIEVWTPVKN